MKPKISPEEYRHILESLELDTLYLSEISSRLREEFLTQTLHLDVDEKELFSQENNTLKVSYNFKLTAKDESMDEPGIFLQARYIVRYQITREVQVTKAFMKVFSDLTVGMLLWPYFRELVNNMVYRMGMPPLVLPMKKR